MEIVLVDKFIVPDESKARFLEEVHKSASFLRTLPGFVEVSLANCNFRKPQGMSQSKMNSSSTGVPSGGLRLHTQGGWDFCLYRRRFGTAPKRRQPLPAARGHLPKWPPIRQAEQFAPSAAAMPLSQRLLARSCHNFGVGLCLQEPFGAAASASGENLLENDATGLDTGALSADRTILQPPPPVVYCSRWIE